MLKNLSGVEKAIMQAENKALLELMKALKALDTLNDKRFEAFDAVIQAQMDAIEEIGVKVDKLAGIKPAPVDLEPVKKAIAEVRGAIKPPPPPADMSRLEKLVGDIALRVAFVEKECERNCELIERLLKAKRVPEFDLEGNVIAVRLQA